MDHYLEIKVLPDPEFKENVLLNALFAKLHRALVDVGQGEIGVSFPQAGKSLGTVLRLHGTAAALSRLMAQNWLKGLRDYSESSEIAAVPATAHYRVVRRVQIKSNPARLRRRSVSKGWLDAEQALQRIPDSKAQKTALPFLILKSNTNAQEFLLFIDQGEIQKQPVSGKFSHYGLSTQATIPHF